MNRMGTNTQTVVSVEANSEPATSSVPRHALSNASSPLSRRLVMLSMTTMLLSTSIPMPTASPPSDTILKVTPSRYSAAMAASTDSGIVTEMISDSEKRRRNTKITATASTPPMSSELRILPMLSLMNSASSSSSSTDESRCSPSSRARTASEMSTALAPAAAITSTVTLGRPL